MRYAHITDGAVDQMGVPPRLAVVDGEWLDLRTLAPDVLAAAGWFPVVQEDRPDDTAATTWDRVESFDGSTVTVGWVERDKTDEELDSDAALARVEREAIRNAAILDAIEATASPPEDGGAWVQPDGAHDAYPEGATVTHNGKTWVSLTPYNVWEPGVSGWREEVSEGYAEWVRPTGGHDAYGVGDRVTFEGQNYESAIAANVWSPTEYPAGWIVIT